MAGRAVSFRSLAGRAADRMSRVVFPGTTDPELHWQRKAMNDAADTRIAALGPERLRAAEISGDNHSDKPWKSFESLDFPEFDLCAPVGKRAASYDVVICEQVLEHVVEPFAAAANISALLKPGGMAIVSTPFLIKVHELPEFALPDYWRFTPRGLATLLEAGGLEIEEVGSWGNRTAVLGNLDRWAAFRPWHPMRNRPDIPLQVWAFARRPV